MASNPEPDPDEVSTVLSPGLWWKVSLQCLPPPPGIGENFVAVEPLHIPSLRWGGGGGVHTMAGTPEFGLGVHLWGVKRLPPSPTT